MFSWAIEAMLARKRNDHEGMDLVRSVLGAKVTGLRRHVFLLDRVNDENGHGITELVTDLGTLAIGAGPNDESIVIAPGPVDPDTLDPSLWTPVITDPEGRWNGLRGCTVRFVDVYSNGLEDVAFVFSLSDGKRFSVVLHETNLVLARDLEPFRREGRRDLPRFRERIQ
jgi:hypothetical protein